MSAFHVTSAFLFVSDTADKPGQMQRLFCADTLERAVELYEEAMLFSRERLIAVSKVNAEAYLEKPENA